jgi:stage III sporulation protein AD
MDAFLQCCGAVLVSVVLILSLGGKGKEFAALLALFGCCFTLLTATRYLEPVIGFVKTLVRLGKLDDALVTTLLKAVGIGILSELSALICTDAGNGGLGKALQILGTSVILWLSIPLFTMVLELIQALLGEL